MIEFIWNFTQGNSNFVSCPGGSRKSIQVICRPSTDGTKLWRFTHRASDSSALQGKSRAFSCFPELLVNTEQLALKYWKTLQAGVRPRKEAACITPAREKLEMLQTGGWLDPLPENRSLTRDWTTTKYRGEQGVTHKQPCIYGVQRRRVTQHFHVSPELKTSTQKPEPTDQAPFAWTAKWTKKWGLSASQFWTPLANMVFLSDFLVPQKTHGCHSRLRQH